MSSVFVNNYHIRNLYLMPKVLPRYSDSALVQEVASDPEVESPSIRSICTSPLPINATEDPDQILTSDVVELFINSLNTFFKSLQKLNASPSVDIQNFLIEGVNDNKHYQLIDAENNDNINTYLRVAKYIKQSIDESNTLFNERMSPPPDHPAAAEVAHDKKQLTLSPQEILVFAAMGTNTTSVTNLYQLLCPESTHSPVMELVSYPIINKLKAQLGTVKPLYSAEIFNALNDAINFLDASMQISIEIMSPVPLFKRIWLVDDRIHYLLKSKNVFALRILFVFSCLCLITRLQFMNEINVWVDYIEWFKTYSLGLSNLNLEFYRFDNQLYNLVVINKYRINPNNLHDLARFDPEMIQIKPNDNNDTTDFTLNEYGNYY